MIAAKSGLGLLVQTFSGRFDLAGVMALILVVACMVMALTSLMEFAERRLLACSKGSTDVPDSVRGLYQARAPRIPRGRNVSTSRMPRKPTTVR